MSEQRQTRRVKVAVAAVFESQDLHFFAEVGDLSESGILLHTGHDFPLGRRLRLAFAPSPEGPNITVEGIVRWSERGRGVGVEFVSFSADSRQTLRAFLDGRLPDPALPSD